MFLSGPHPTPFSLACHRRAGDRGKATGLLRDALIVWEGAELVDVRTMDEAYRSLECLEATTPVC